MSNQIVKSDGGFIAPVADVQTALRRYQAVKDFISEVLREGVDYGKVPGSDKDTLLKPGAEKMTAFFGFTVKVNLEDCVEDWTGAEHNGEPFFYYRYRTQLWRSDQLVAEGEGSCNSWEKKYRYRQQERICPVCEQATIKRSKYAPRDNPNAAPGWYCYAKIGGCGTNFSYEDPNILEQQTGLMKNPDPAEQVNTYQKMAQKRSLVAPVLIATNTSDYFTQDMEDFLPSSSQEPVIEANFREEQPTVKKKNGNGRPYAPNILHDKLDQAAVFFDTKGMKATDRHRKILAAQLQTLFDGDDTKRYEFSKWATGVASTTEMTDDYVLALLNKWLEVDSFGQPPNEYAMQEAKAALPVALKDAGQEEMPL